MKYEIGQKLFSRGDMANTQGWFVITEIVNNKYFSGYELTEIESEHSENRQMKRIMECCISDVDKGNGSTRLVTEQAYKTLREQQNKHNLCYISANNNLLVDVLA